MVAAVLAFASPAAVRSADWVALDHNSNLQAAYLVRDNRGTAITIELWLNVGEADFAGPEGRAHYLEHLVAIGALRIGGEGVIDSHSNAQVSQHWTPLVTISVKHR